MQYLYFEDWSDFSTMLDEKGVSNSGRIIKAYSSPVDPRMKNRQIKVVKVDDSPLLDENYNYETRGSWPGTAIEEKIAGLAPLAKDSFRALFRFANREDLRFCQTGMSLKKGSEWLIAHPADEVDGVELALRQPLTRSSTVHLDIFNEKSLERLSKIVDISEGSTELMSRREGLILKRELLAGVNSGTPERE